MSKEYLFEAELLIPAPVEKVFEFFSDAQNLERITPEILNFKIVTPLPIRMQKGTLIDYKIKIRGVPAKWKTLIDAWEPPFLFIDSQINGPYKMWQHTHSFKTVEGGTLMKDSVRYSLPFGIFGQLVHPFLVRPDVEKIFRHRNGVISKYF